MCMLEMLGQKTNKNHLNAFHVNASLFKRQLHKIIKHIQTICRHQPMNCLSVLDHFMGLAPKRLVFIRYNTWKIR